MRLKSLAHCCRLAIVAVTAAAPAVAGTLYYLQGHVEVTLGGTGINQHTYMDSLLQTWGLSTHDFLENQSMADATYGGWDTATAGAKASMGTLKSTNFAGTTSTETSLYVVDSETDIKFGDWIMASGPGTFMFTMDLGGQFTHTGSRYTGDATLQLYIISGTYANLFKEVILHEDNTCYPYASCSTELYWTMTPANYLDMGGYFEIVAELDVTDGAMNNSTVTANIANTAHIYADSETPDVTLTSSSGHNYSSSASAVPEPATCLLAAAGVLALIRLRKRA